MKVIKFLIILFVWIPYAIASAFVLEATAMINNYVSMACLDIVVIGMISLGYITGIFNDWFNGNLRTNNVKTNENSNNPS